MIGIIKELVTQPSAQQAQVVVSLIGLVSASIVAVFGLLGSAITFFLNKRSERIIDLRKTKENQYLEFLGSLASLKVATDQERHEIQDILSKRVQTIYLVGSKGVQTSLKELLDYLLGDASDLDQQNKLYASLIREMRKDLYGKRSQSLGSILLTTFRD